MGAPQWLFEPFRLDPVNAHLWRGAELVALQPRVFDVLHYLVTHPHRLVTKDELLDAVWPATAVSDAVVRVAIGALRKALDDPTRTPRLIATVPHRGYRFVAPVTEFTPPAPTPTPPSPPRPLLAPPLLVEREVVLQHLQAAWQQARHGVRQVVFVTGEAGLGKTAVVETLAAQVRIDPTVELATGQCVEHYGTGEAYLPILEALGSLCQGPRGADLVALVRQHAPTWLVQMPWLLTAADREALHSELQGATRERMLRECAAVVEALTAARPLLLILEDLHWSDYATVDLLAMLARRCPPARLLVVGTYRPVETLVQQHPLQAVTLDLQRHENTTVLSLAGLSAAAVAAYLAARFPQHQFPPALAGWLHQRTDGHPLFLTILVQALVERGILGPTARGWTMPGGLEALNGDVPERLRQLLRQQIRRLPPEAQRVLEVASVAGVEFVAAAVGGGLAADTDAVEECCEALVAQELLCPLGVTTWPNSVVATRYAFRHELYQQVVYQGLGAGRRVRLHQRLGEYLEAVYGAQAPTIATALAMHFTRAQDWHRTIQYLHHAADNAMQRAAYQEAVTCLEQALRALKHLPEHSDTRVLAIDFRLTLRGALVQLGEYGRCLTLLGEAEALARALDDRARLGRVLAMMVPVLSVTGDPDGSIAAGQQALALAAELGESALQMQASLQLWQGYQALGDFALAAELLRRNVEAADRESGQPNTALRILSRVWLALTLGALGAFAEGRRHGEEALRLATLEGRGSTPITVHACLGWLYLVQGDLKHAVRMLEQGLSLSRASGNRDWLRPSAAGLGYAYALQGRLAEGCTLLEEALSESISTGAHQGHSRWLPWLSAVCRLAGRHDEAWQHARQALELARQQKARGNEVHALHQLGAVYAHTDPPEVAQAEAYYQQALALAEELGMRPLQAHCHRGFGTLYAKLGQREQACTALSTAIELYRAMEMTFWLPEAEAALARAEGQ